MTEKNQKMSVCDKIFSVISCNPQHNHGDAHETTGWVPIVFDDHARKDRVHKAMVQKPSLKAPEKPTKHVRLQVEKEKDESEKPRPARVFSEYIARAGTRIRADSSVAARKPMMRRDSLNKRVSEYINRAKMRFTTKPSFGEHSN